MQYRWLSILNCTCVAIYGPMIYTARTYAFDAGKSIMRKIGRGIGPRNRDFLGPVKWHRAVRWVPFGAQKRRGQPPPTCPSNRFARNQSITYRALSIRGPQIVLCTWVSVFCILYSEFCICILYSVFCILYSVLCILYSVFCILYSVFCILYSVFFILYSVFSILFCSVFCINYSVFCVLFSEFCSELYLTSASTLRTLSMLAKILCLHSSLVSLVTWLTATTNTTTHTNTCMSSCV